MNMKWGLKLLPLRLCFPPTIPACPVSLLAIIWTFAALKPSYCQTVCNSSYPLLRGTFNRRRCGLSACSFFPSAVPADIKSHIGSIPIALLQLWSLESIPRTGECFSVAQLNLSSAVPVKGQWWTGFRATALFTQKRERTDVTEPEKGCCRARLPSSHSWQEVGSDSFPSQQWLSPGEGSSRSKSHFLGLWHRWCRIRARAGLFLKAICCPQ